ncbi:MAG: ABC transporter permease [Lachnospiraceae bacterium]|nr:ABC transporter permease [Lachnospiraceae bacterium]
MNRKSKLIGLCLLILAVAANVLIFNWHTYKLPTVDLHLTVSSEVGGNLQIFYSDYADSWVEGNSSGIAYDPVNGAEQTVALSEDGEPVIGFLPAKTEAQAAIGAGQRFIRLDPGDQEAIWTISDMSVSYKDMTADWQAEDLGEPLEVHDMTAVEAENGALVLSARAGDPYVIFAMPETAPASQAVADSDASTLRTKVLALVLLDAVVLAFLLFRKKLLTLPLEIMQNRHLIFKLAVNDFKTKYAGSYLGIFWAFVQPVVTIMVYWFVFSVGFRSGAVMNVPFVVYLVTGLVPWFFIQDFMNAGTNALVEYSYLVKKVVFKISVLPMVKAISALFVHAFFVAITILITVLYGINPGPYAIQVVYYFFAMFVFGLGIVYGTCAIVIFFRDLTQIINIVLQVGVWTIPIMWNIGIIDPKWHWFFKLNPMYYIVNGYREAIYGHTWFWHDLGQMVYFWAVTLILFVIGTTIFKRLKVHFADVL